MKIFAATILGFASSTLGATPTRTIAPGVEMPQVNLGTCCGSTTVGYVRWEHYADPHTSTHARTHARMHTDAH